MNNRHAERLPFQISLLFLLALICVSCAPSVTEKIWPKHLGFGVSPEVWLDEFGASRNAADVELLRERRSSELDAAARALALEVRAQLESCGRLLHYLAGNGFECTTINNISSVEFQCSAMSEHQYNIYGVPAPDTPFKVKWNVSGTTDRIRVVRFFVLVRDAHLGDAQVWRLKGASYDAADQ